MNEPLTTQLIGSGDHSAGPSLPDRIFEAGAATFVGGPEAGIAVLIWRALTDLLRA